MPFHVKRWHSVARPHSQFAPPEEWRYGRGAVEFDESVREALAELEQRGLLRAPRLIDGPHGPELVVQGRRVVGLCSNDYLGLASDPRISAAAAQALDTARFGAAASRHISGSNRFHTDL